MTRLPQSPRKKAEKAIVRAAMRWHRFKAKNNGAYSFDHLHQIGLACARYAKAKP